MTPLVGILLAAGRGRRMGRTKQLLPWPTTEGPTTVVTAAFDAIAPVCRAIVVVAGHEAEAVVATLDERAFVDIRADPDAPMFESLRAGLEAVELQWPGAAVLVHPADCPGVAPATVEEIAAAGRANPTAAIQPRHGTRGGHPVLIPPSMIELLRVAPGERGLRGFLADRPEQIHRVPTNDPGIAQDLDDEHAYQRAVAASDQANGG